MDDRKITVAVCGDSFCAASVHDLQAGRIGLRAHFSQMLEDVYGYQVLHYAHGGFSNLAILFQLQEACKQNVDVVVYSKTWSSRFELYQHDFVGPDAGMHNFFYYDPCFESTNSDRVGDQNAPILSTTPSNVEHSPFFSVTREQKQAIDLYFKYLHNEYVKTLTDGWMFDYWRERMIEKNILPVEFNQPQIGKMAYDFAFSHPNYDCPFHTDRATQEQIASNVHQYIVDNLPKKL